MTRTAVAERDAARRAKLWLDTMPVDDLMLQAVTAIVRERRGWVAYPISDALEEVTRWVTAQGYPLPPTWPRDPQHWAWMLGRLRVRLLMASIRWDRCRLGGWRTKGMRPKQYLFTLWGPQGLIEAPRDYRHLNPFPLKRRIQRQRLAVG
jgi:hypothetical protein